MKEMKEKEQKMLEILAKEDVGMVWDKTLEEARQCADGDAFEKMAVELFTDEVADFTLHIIQAIEDSEEKKKLLKFWHKANWKKIALYLIDVEGLEAWM